jgi:hypothetical protein
MEWFWLPAGGGVTVTSALAYSKCIGVYIGACDGAGGGAGTLGFSNDNVNLGRLDYGIACYEPAKEPSPTAANTFDIGEALDVIIDGTVWCTVETTANLAVTKGDPVAVRVLTVGADVRGQLTRYTSPGMTGTYALVPGAVWLDSAAAGALARVRIGG